MSGPSFWVRLGAAPAVGEQGCQVPATAGSATRLLARSSAKQASRSELKEIQKQGKQRHEAGLQQRVEEAKHKAKEPDDSGAGQKAVKKVEAATRAERQQGSCDRIKRVFKHLAWGGGLQRTGAPKHDRGGKVMMVTATKLGRCCDLKWMAPAQL